MTLRYSLLLLIPVVSVVPVFADEFSFSYTFSTGNAIYGTVEGNLQGDGDTVANLGNLAGFYSARPDTILSFIYRPEITTFKLDGKGITFNGFEVDTAVATDKDFGFYLSDSGTLCVNCATAGNFTIIPSGGILFPFGPDQFEAEPFNPARWTATAVTVPEPSSVALLSMVLWALLVWSPRRVGFRR